MKTTTPIKCYLSERGHNNFWYPSSIPAVISENCEYQKLNWISGGRHSLKAIKVRQECILPLTYTEDFLPNLSPPGAEYLHRSLGGKISCCLAV